MRGMFVYAVQWQALLGWGHKKGATPVLKLANLTSQSVSGSLNNLSSQADFLRFLNNSAVSVASVWVFFSFFFSFVLSPTKQSSAPSRDILNCSMYVLTFQSSGSNRATGENNTYIKQSLWSGSKPWLSDKELFELPLRLKKNFLSECKKYYHRICATLLIFGTFWGFLRWKMQIKCLLRNFFLMLFFK